MTLSHRVLIPTIAALAFLHPVVPPSQQQLEARRSWISQEQKALVLSDLIQRSGAFQAERRKAEQEVNRKRAAAADARRAEDGKLSAKPVPPQVEATQVKPQKRDHATESQRKASTASAQQVGVSRLAPFLDIFYYH